MVVPLQAERATLCGEITAVKNLSMLHLLTPSGRAVRRMKYWAVQVIAHWAIHTQVNSIETDIRRTMRTKLHARLTDLEENVF
jgi:hypothetical protein